VAGGRLVAVTARMERQTVKEARRVVGLLDDQASDLRAELFDLRQNLADVRSDLNGTRSIQLQQANQKLVLAALRADTLAEAAVANLAELTRSNQRDALTGMPNRTLLLDRLQNAIVLARRHHGQLAVLFVDLDHFKSVNDSLGHIVGDSVLQRVAHRMQSALRDCDTVGRYGGDEFLVLLPEISSPVDAARLAAKLLAALTLPIAFDKHPMHISASIGISIYPEDGEDTITLIQHADAAMYQCKRHGPGCYRFHAEQGADPRREGPSPLPTPHVTPPSPRRVAGQVAPRAEDLREANEKLVLAAMLAQEAETQARGAHQQQLKFMAMVAHELRNPLTPLRVAAELLVNRQPTGEIPIERLQVIIDGQVTQMTRLVDDLLDGSRLSTGKLRLQRESVDLIEIIDRIALVIRSGMDKRQQQFTVQLPAGPLEMQGDPVRLAQIFNNLLGNAGKYTPEGGEISLVLEVFDRVVVITVRDNGIGIAAEALPTIFELFVQDARALSHSDGGLGIGLAVVRDLVMAHGGTVTGSSEGRGKGSRFVVTLPTS
jgi:diguanylate cyclase (GGDEF)-like protein